MRSGGSISWRHNNPGLLPLNITTRKHNVLGVAYKVAIFPFALLVGLDAIAGRDIHLPAIFVLNLLFIVHFTRKFYAFICEIHRKMHFHIIIFQSL